jgi:hypothetical protein
VVAELVAEELAVVLLVPPLELDEEQLLVLDVVLLAEELQAEVRAAVVDVNKSI